MPKLLRSALVGIAATAVDVVALLVLVGVAKIPAPIANVPALLLGVGVQFVGNKRFAFRDPSRDYLRQGTLFGLVELGAILLNAVVFHLLVTATPIPYPLARAVGTAAVYFGFSYPLWRHVFRC